MKWRVPSLDSYGGREPSVLSTPGLRNPDCHYVDARKKTVTRPSKARACFSLGEGQDRLPLVLRLDSFFPPSYVDLPLGAFSRVIISEKSKEPKRVGPRSPEKGVQVMEWRRHLWFEVLQPLGLRQATAGMGPMALVVGFGTCKGVWSLLSMDYAVYLSR
jgi:hypothetical protein